ncbi:Presenilin [Aphelenchoides fujianensis]|nr:Presenilin [Aphelenchoides fujianensis]
MFFLFSLPIWGPLTALYLRGLLKNCNLTVDAITFGLLAWNVGLVGMLGVLWNVPQRLHQTSQVLLSALLALWALKLLPGFIVWPFIIFTSLVDFFNEYTPWAFSSLLEEIDKCNPGVQIPALFRSTVTYEGGDGNTKQEDHQELGLGDFLFYSLLVGKASTCGDWNATIGCYVGVLNGSAVNMLLFNWSRKGIPALPLPISLGLLFFVATRQLITPLLANVSMIQGLI